jgi:hypothetical protein
MAGNAQGADELDVKLHDPEQARALLEGGTLDTVQNLVMSIASYQSESDVRAIGLLIADYLARNTSLKRLSLDPFSPYVPLSRALVLALKNHPSLEILKLSHSPIREVEVQGLSEISSSTSLKQLHVSTHYFFDDGMMALSEVLKTNTACKIETLDIDWNCARPGIGHTAWLALADALASNRTVKVLNIGHQGEKLLNADAFAALCESFKTNDMIEDLEIQSLPLGDAGAQVLGLALASHHSLTKLNVCYNDIGDDGCTAMAEALKINTVLTLLDFAANDFGDAGSKALAEMLPFNTTLRFMDLTWNGMIGEEGARALGTAWGDMANQDLTISFTNEDHLELCDSAEFDDEKRIETVMLEARDHQVELRRWRELLLAFGMGLHDRLGGRKDWGSGISFSFCGMDGDIFRLIGDAY